MARLDRFYLPPERWQPPYVLEGEAARHLLTVLRAAPGRRLICFDGQGGEGEFALASVRKHAAHLELLGQRHLPRPPGPTLAVGWHKFGRRDFLLEKAVELEAAQVIFWGAARSQGSPPATPKPTWRAKCLAAAAQCGAVWLPELTTLPDVPALLAVADAYPTRVVLWESPQERHPLDPHALASGSSLLVVGPEGGLEEREVDALRQAGCQPATLGRRVLRLETAALLALGLIFWARHGTSAREES